MLSQVWRPRWVSEKSRGAALARELFGQLRRRGGPKPRNLEEMRFLDVFHMFLVMF